ncbi:TonB-dependent receptor, partial [Pseudomonas sp. FW305-130]
VVTGSRIGRPELQQASPISVISSQEIALSGQINVENILKDLPQLVPSTTGASNNPGGGVSTADLRGLGPTRTLVLVNGRRYISYDAKQIVDLNTV